MPDLRKHRSPVFKITRPDFDLQKLMSGPESGPSGPVILDGRLSRSEGSPVVVRPVRSGLAGSSSPVSGPVRPPLGAAGHQTPQKMIKTLEINNYREPRS
jgi:hypothetical protein